MSLDLYSHIFAPSDAPDAATAVLLHGTGGDAAGFLELGQIAAPGLNHLALDGDVLEGGARRFFRRKAEGVYDFDDLAARTDRLAAFLSAAAERYDAEPTRLVGIGYSNGANILANLSFSKPAALKRVVLMHPLIPYEPPEVDLTGLEVLITAGRRDPICPPAMTERLVAAYQARGAQAAVVWRPGGHQMDGSELDETRGFILK